MTKPPLVEPLNPVVTDCDTVTVRDIKRIKTNLRRRRQAKRPLPWKEIATEYPAIIKAGTLQRFAMTDYIPQDAEILKALGVRVLPKLPMDILRIIRGGV